MQRTLVRFFSNAFIGIFFCIIGISLLEGYQQRAQVEKLRLQRVEYDQTLLRQSQSIVKATNENSSKQEQEQRGTIKGIDGSSNMTTEQLNTNIDRKTVSRRGLSYAWRNHAGSTFAYSAMGIDKKHYFANSYLVGYVPFITQSVWEPLLVLSMRKHYMFDHDLYGPNMKDVWQNSRQAYQHSHGDCEDHALILADWLIGLGYDARVALGKLPEGGHAWVVLFHNSQEYILESTSKRRPRSLNDFKLARYSTEYRPEYQFNRTDFWENTGSSYTTRYNDQKWVIKSHFNKSS